MKTLKVRVTREHIKMGKRVTLTMCPIALALKPLYPEVSVDSYHIRLKRFTNTKPSVEVTTPRKASEFVQAFDGNLPVKPFTFTLRVP